MFYFFFFCAVTQRVSLVLWSQLDTERREQHISCVELFYRLHCLAPSASICEDIICQALLHKDKVKHTGTHMLNRSLFTHFSFLPASSRCVSFTGTHKPPRKCDEFEGLPCVRLPQAVRLEALHRFTVLWHLTREIQTNRTMSLNRSFDRLVRSEKAYCEYCIFSLSVRLMQLTCSTYVSVFL